MTGNSSAGGEGEEGGGFRHAAVILLTGEEALCVCVQLTATILCLQQVCLLLLLLHIDSLVHVQRLALAPRPGSVDLRQHGQEAWRDVLDGFDQLVLTVHVVLSSALALGPFLGSLVTARDVIIVSARAAEFRVTVHLVLCPLRLCPL